MTTEETEKAAVVAEVKKQIEATEKKIEEKPQPVQQVAAGKYPYIDFRPAPMNTFESIEDAPENEDDSLLPRNIKAAHVSGNQTVFINAIDGDTWLSYQVDGEEIKRLS
jgi:cytoskeleton protein RodZ